MGTPIIIWNAVKSFLRSPAAKSILAKTGVATAVAAAGAAAGLVSSQNATPDQVVEALGNEHVGIAVLEDAMTRMPSADALRTVQELAAAAAATGKRSVVTAVNILADRVGRRANTGDGQPSATARTDKSIVQTALETANVIQAAAGRLGLSVRGFLAVRRAFLMDEDKVDLALAHLGIAVH